MVQTGRMVGDQGSSAATAVWSVADRYIVGPCIGRGGMAEVYEGHDTRLDRSVAVKVLKAQYAGDEVLRRRLTSEARAAARLSHPNVARVYDVGEHDGLPYIVMELVSGGTLAGRLQDPPMGQGAAVRLTIQVLAALDAAHRAGILHRDIKPANILLTEEGEAKVTDFGIAKAVEPAPDELDLTVTSEVMGTPRYLAPERAGGDKASVASDIWSVGVVLYEALTGRPPFDADTPLALAVAAERGDFVHPETYRPDIPPAVGTVVTRALAPRPPDRYATASAMADALSRAVADPGATAAFEPPTAPYPAVGEVPEKGFRPSRRALMIGGGLAVSLLVLAAATLLLLRGSRPDAAAAPPSPSTTLAPSVPPTTLPPAPATTSPTTAAPVTEAPTTTSTSVPGALSCSVLRADRQALQRRQAQIDKAEKSPTRRQAADRAIAAQEHAIDQVMRQFC